jgi:hypothetical protein
MSYFNHAFKKAFLANSTASYGTATSSYETGQIGLVDPKTWLTVDMTDTPTASTGPLYLVAGSLRNVDQIGPFSGGYTESVKSKLINPKYVSAFYRVDDCQPQQMQITVGSTYSENPCNLNSGSDTNKVFACNSTYNLRVDIKGSPVLRFLTRNTYYTAAAYTGCCPEGVDGIGAPVNPLIVYVQWAYQLLNSPLISPFIKVEVTYSTAAGVWNELPGTDGTNSTLNLEVLLGYINNPSTLPTVDNTLADNYAGLIITGAYVDTEFGKCTFYPNDSIIAKLEPVKVYASEVDLNGDPCAFGGVCVANQCDGYQGTGLGESALRDLIMTEAYMQQPFYTGMDLRIREILKGGNLGTDATDAITLSNDGINPYFGYTRYYIQHSVPRFNNPTGTFDNDQYMLEIIAPADPSVVADLETYMIAWLEASGNYNYNPKGLPLNGNSVPLVECHPTCVNITPNWD